MTIHPVKINWFSVETHKPPEGVKLMVTGPSMMRGSAKNYLMLAHIDEEYRPSLGGPLRWIDIHNDAVTDGYAQPTHWAYPIEFPERA